MKQEAPAHIPSWLSNPELIAPCPCGMPMIMGLPYYIGEGETGLKRVFHQQCWMMMQNSMEDDDD